MAQYNVAVVGALGMVGTEMIKTLERRNFPVKNLHPLDLAVNAGKTLSFKGKKVAVKTAEKQNFKGIDIALISAGATASKQLAPQAVEMGAVVIDNSSQWRMNPDCPLVIPEVNPNDLKWHKGIIPNPNCSTILMVTVLKPLYDRSRITRVIVSTYQAAAGGGLRGYEGLQKEIDEYIKTGQAVEPRVHPVQLAFNAIPHIDVFMDQGYTKEEYKMVEESQKILGDDGVRVSATCVRIPVFVGHSESVYIETEKRIGAEDARNILSSAAGIIVKDDPENNIYPTPLECENQDEILVGRIREDLHEAKGLNLWIVTNNIRKGAALNAVQIAEKLIEMDLIRVPGKR